MAAGLFLLLNGRLINGVWLAFIGWFLANAAASSYRQFLLMRAISGVPVSLVLRRAPAVPAEMSALELAGLFVGGASSSLPVVQEGRMTGIVDLDVVAKLPLDRRTSTTVGELMSDLAGTASVPPHETLDRVVMQLQKTDGEHVLVVDGDRFLGVVTLDDIGDWVQRARKLGLDRSDVGLRELLAGGGPVADGSNEDGPRG
jgi:CBS domain-containing protein